MTPLPRWIRVLDALALVALALGLFVLLFGGFVISVGGARLSARSPDRLLFAAVALIAVRHTAYSRESLPIRIRRGVGSLRAGSPFAIAAEALVTRLAVLAVAYFAVLTVGLATASVGFELSADPLLNLPARFDAGWYGGIAQDGYYFQGRFDRQQNVAFFPAFPLLMRTAGTLVGGFEPGVPKGWREARLLWVGVLLSMLAFAWAAVFLVRLARDAGLDEEQAHAAAALLAAYPFAAFFSAPYTEGLFLLGAVAAFYHFRRREWIAAAAWGLLVGVTRPNGCFLSVALAVLVAEALWRNRRSQSAEAYPVVTALAAASASGLGMLAYSAYVKHLTGAWFGWARLHEAWGRSFQGLAPAARAAGWLSNEGLFRVFAGVPFDTLNTCGLIFALIMIWPVWRRLGPAWAVFILINVAPPYLAGGVLSMGRVTATLFPLFVALAVVLPRRAVAPTLTAFALGQGLVAVLFFTWRPLF